jgi:predicted flap endonuclease-1-like 5' DNA nuclease
MLGCRGCAWIGHQAPETVKTVRRYEVTLQAERKGQNEMSYKIQEIEGIGPSYAEKLMVAKIKTTNDLLKYCCDAKGRVSVSARTGVGEPQLLKWANMADLMRVSGIGSEFSELLEAAGVDTVKELRMRNADNLSEKMREVNAARRLTRTTPSAKTVQKWISHAAGLSPVITH